MAMMWWYLSVRFECVFKRGFNPEWVALFWGSGWFEG